MIVGLLDLVKYLEYINQHASLDAVYLFYLCDLYCVLPHKQAHVHSVSLCPYSKNIWQMYNLAMGKDFSFQRILAFLLISSLCGKCYLISEARWESD